MQIEHAMHNLHDFVKRRLESDVYKRISIFPAVLVLGSRQCGKSTLVKMLAAGKKDFLRAHIRQLSD